METSGHEWNVMYVYSSPILEDRVRVWNLMLSLLTNVPNCILLGDFNHVEYHSDKLGGSSVIRGWMEFLDWRINSNFLEVPFLGP